MAKHNFDTNKRSDRNFDTAKRSTRQFDLSKDDDEITVGGPIVEEVQGNDPEPRGKSRIWVAIAGAVAVIAILAIWLIPGAGTDNTAPTENEAQDNLMANADATTSTAEDLTSEDLTANQPEEETATQSADNLTDENADRQQEQTAQPTGNTTETSQPRATVAESSATQQHNRPQQQTTTTATPAQTPATQAVNTPSLNDIDAEAMEVIRGKYGNNPDRKNALGDRYAEIQRRVNQLMQQYRQ